MVLANLFDDRESDIGRSGDGEWPATIQDAPAARARTGRPLTLWVVAAALVLLVIEWAAWRRTQVRR